MDIVFKNFKVFSGGIMTKSKPKVFLSRKPTDEEAIKICKKLEKICIDNLELLSFKDRHYKNAEWFMQWDQIEIEK